MSANYLEEEAMAIYPYIVVVAIARDGVAGFLCGRLLALGLESGRHRVHVALQLVAKVLGG